MDNISLWIENLNDPLILSGFALFLLAGLVKLFNTEKLTRNATRDLINKGLNFVFILGLLIVVLGFGMKWQELQSKQSHTQKTESHTEQTMTGTSGVAVQSGRDSNVNAGEVGEGTLSQKVGKENPESVPLPASQKMENTQGIAIQSGRDTNSQSQ